MTKAYMIFLALLIILVFICIKKENIKVDGFSITAQIKGIAILLVILGHLSRVAEIHNSLLNFLGAQGVMLFLTISGYGLFKSYNIKGITWYYWKKRIVTVLIPYSIVTAAFIFWEMFFFHREYSAVYIIKNILGLDSSTRFDGTMWYIQFILTWYIIFGFVFYFKMLRNMRITILFIFSIMFYIQINRQPLSMYYYQCAVHAFWFPLGVLIGRYSDYFYKLIISNIRIFIVTSAFVITSTSILGKIDNNNFYILYNMSISVVFGNIIFIISNLRLRSKFLVYVGSISFYLYLFEGLFIYNYEIINRGKPFISLGYYILIVLLLSIGYKKSLEYLQRHLFKSIQNYAFLFGSSKNMDII